MPVWDTPAVLHPLSAPECRAFELACRSVPAWSAPFSLLEYLARKTFFSQVCCTSLVWSMQENTFLSRPDVIKALPGFPSACTRSETSMDDATDDLVLRSGIAFSLPSSLNPWYKRKLKLNLINVSDVEKTGGYKASFTITYLGRVERVDRHVRGESDWGPAWRLQHFCIRGRGFWQGWETIVAVSWKFLGPTWKISISISSTVDTLNILTLDA